MNPSHILIVDDDPALLLALPEALRLRMGEIIIDTCDSAATALEKIAVTDYDAIISDIKMPGMDGLALLAEIRTRRPNTPALLITGHGENDLAVQALRGGAYDFIQKPIDRDYVVASLTRAIHTRQLSRQVEEQKAALARHASELEQIVEERTHELREANKAKDEFLATISHELRTPLTAILGWARLLRTGKLDEAASARAVESIERNTKLQAQLIDDLLDISRIITGKLRFDAHPIELVPVIEAAIDAMSPAAEAKTVRFESTLDHNAGPILGDPYRLQQVVWNLLSNAIKFTPEGGLIEVSLKRINLEAVITVSDTGEGISPDFLPYIFDSFCQADGTITRKHSGLGLGLAIVRHLVEMHGGRVEVDSEGEGRGATFTVRLPLATVQKERFKNEILKHRRPPVIKETPFYPLPTIKGFRVLVVDDQADALDLLVITLEQYGAAVTGVRSAAEALAVLDQMQPDVILSDIGMPGEDGYTLIRKVRERPPERGGLIPAAALTAYARSEDRTRALLAGFQMHLPKPIEPIELIAVIANLVKRSERAKG